MRTINIKVGETKQEQILEDGLYLMQRKDSSSDLAIYCKYSANSMIFYPTGSFHTNLVNCDGFLNQFDIIGKLNFIP